MLIIANHSATPFAVYDILLQTTVSISNSQVATITDELYQFLLTIDLSAVDIELVWTQYVISDIFGLQTALDAKEGTITAGTTAQYYRGDKTFQALDKTAVGLWNVDNTTDAAKPVSTAQQTALDAKKTDSMATNKLLGRGTAWVGAIEEIILGTNLSMTGGTLNAVGGTPAWNNQALQFNNNGAFGASDNLFTDGSILSLLPTSSANRIVNGSFDSSSASWTLGTWWTHSAWKVRKTLNGTWVLSQSFTVWRGELYKVVYTISDWTVGTIAPALWGVTMPTVSSNGTYTEYVFTTNNSSISFNPSNTSRFSIDDVSVFNLSWGIIRTWGLQIVWQSVVSRVTSSSSLWNTSHYSLQNPTGNHSYIDAFFGNNCKSAIGFTSSGAAQLFQTWGSGIEFYSGISSPTLSAYLNATIFLHYWNGSFWWSVSIGQNQTEPPSTKTVYGSSGEKWEYLTAGTVLTWAYTYVHANADESSSCSWTITNACSFWTTQSDCEKWNAHGWCSWNDGNPCSTYNNEFWMSSCAGQVGCTVEPGDCSVAGDETSCNAQNDAYGGDCMWENTPQDCSTFDEMDCWNYWWCSSNYDSCSNYNDGGGDWAACNDANWWAWCSYDTWTGECTGDDWFTGCTGNWDLASCTWEFNTGICLGSYDSGCFGTSMCGGITTSPNCWFEPWCDWVSGITLQFPVDTGVAFYRSYFIRNIAVTANVTMIPNTDQTVNDTTSNLITPWKSKHYSFVFISLPCWNFNGTDESTCLTGHPGCAWNVEELECSQFGTEETCTSSGCSWDWMSCSWVYSANTCEWSWTYKRDWSIFAQY